MIEIARTSLSDIVTKTIIRYINQGRFIPGDRLPSNEELAQMFNVGRSSVREALKELQTLGVVTLKHGDGTYVCPLAPAKNGPVLLEKTTEMRRMVEVYCAQVAATHCDQEILDFIQNMHNGMVKSFNDETEFIYYDRQFHYGIAKSTNNPFISKMYSSMEILFAELQYSIVWLKDSKEKALMGHERILKAIMEKDPERAVCEVNKHLDSIVEQIIEIHNENKI